MEVVALIGRIILGLLVLMFGMNHFAMKDNMVGYAQMKGAPAPQTSVPLAGVYLIVVGLALVLGVYPSIAAWLLIAWLVVVSLVMHAFWKEDDPMARQNDMTHVLKHIAWIGALLVAIGGDVWGAAIITL